MSTARANGNGDAYDDLAVEERQPEDDKQTPWKQRKKMLRGFLLTNSYVPLVSSQLRTSCGTKKLKLPAPSVIPLCEHHLHHFCAGHRDTNTSAGDEPSRQRRCG